MAVTKSINQGNLGNSVTSRPISWLDLSMRSWGSEFHAPDHQIYQFSNGRSFDSSDIGKTGIYGVSGINYLMVEDSPHADMASNSHLLQDDFTRIILE